MSILNIVNNHPTPGRTNKECSVCRSVKTLDLFPKNKNTKDGVTSRCKECHNAISRKYSVDFPDKARATRVKSRIKRRGKHAEYHLKKKYGLTMEQKKEILDKQHGMCAICGIKFETLSKAYVDHNHATGQIRGCLCHQCNVSIGLLKEDSQRIENIRLYLADHDGNYASVSKFTAYLKERENVDTIETREGYATYVISGDECYIRDIFVLSQFRRQRFASSIADRIAKIATGNGCKFLTGSVCPSTSGATASLNVLIGYGMKLYSSQDNLIIFKKDLVSRKDI